MHPRRLIEADLPIATISREARREKSIRRGHISTLHIWWARRPLAACRAVLLAALLPDPADESCPPSFRERARALLAALPGKQGKRAGDLGDPLALRNALLDLIGEASSWEKARDGALLEACRGLVLAGNEALGGEGPPLVVDPFAGGGTIPLEALRVGARAFSSDLNPVAVLLEKVLLELTPEHGERLAREVRSWGEKIRREAARELGKLYPTARGERPVAWLWARTIRCEGPRCGSEVPLLRSLTVVGRGKTRVSLRLFPNRRKRQVGIEIVHGAARAGEGTVKRATVTCPVCGFTTRVARVRAQLCSRRGGARDARLVAVVTRDGRALRHRLPRAVDLAASRAAARLLAKRERAARGPLSLVPDEPIFGEDRRNFWVALYGCTTMGDLFTARQALALSTLARLVRGAHAKIARESGERLAEAVTTCLALAVDRCADYGSSLAVWAGSFIAHTFGRQALPFVWDFAEAAPLGDGTGSLASALSWVEDAIVWNARTKLERGRAVLASATEHPLEDGAADLVFTDPPYWDAVPYADLSDFFYVWLRRSLAGLHGDLLSSRLTEKERECVVNPAAIAGERAAKDSLHFERTLRAALSEARRLLRPGGALVLVFAQKTTEGWEAALQAVIDAGLRVTASWPIDTERPGRFRAQRSAALASSIHLVCRSREAESTGEWAAVEAEISSRIAAFLPRLAREGVVGADAIFACLGPALEVFSRHARVEKAPGERVSLRDLLERVWAAVAREALSTILDDAASFEPEARLTALWLWARKPGEDGFSLDGDAARKIARAAGTRLEALPSVVEANRSEARLLRLDERSPRGGGVLDRLHRAMTLFGGESAGALAVLLEGTGAADDERVWRLAQALSALYPRGSLEKRRVDGLLAMRKRLGRRKKKASS